MPRPWITPPPPPRPAWRIGAVSLAIHGLLLAVVVGLTGGPEPVEPAEELDAEVTYFDIAAFAPPAAAPGLVAQGGPAAPAAPEPTPVPEQAAEPAARPEPAPDPTEVVPAPPTDLTDPGPPAPADIAVPQPSGESLEAVAAPAATDTSPGSGVTGGRTTAGAGGAPGGEGLPGTPGGSTLQGERTYTTSMVDEPPELLDRDRLPRLLARLYPRELRRERVQGRVVVTFVVGRDGRVVEETVEVLSATRPEFGDATRKALPEFRFRPARVNGSPVRTRIQVPLLWEVIR